MSLCGWHVVSECVRVCVCVYVYVYAGDGNRKHAITFIFTVMGKHMKRKSKIHSEREMDEH